MDFSNNTERQFYETCSSKKDGLTTQEFSLQYPDATAQEMALAVNTLLTKGYLEVFQVRGELIYKSIKKEEAGKSAGLQGEEQVVYNTIRAAANEGIWTKHLKAKTNLHEIVIKRCLRALEQKAMVKAIKSVKHPTRKLYMLMELTPSVDVTGGPWFTDQELDVDFVEQLTNACYKFILMKVT
ncbi:34-kDa subunit of RNA polymerase III (C) [Podila humilis]|nr:34-kDa subunit of RNA polymerase III (C) [Podila humilis]